MTCLWMEKHTWCFPDNLTEHMDTVYKLKTGIVDNFSCCSIGSVYSSSYLSQCCCAMFTPINLCYLKQEINPVLILIIQSILLILRNHWIIFAVARKYRIPLYVTALSNSGFISPNRLQNFWLPFQPSVYQTSQNNMVLHEVI